MIRQPKVGQHVQLWYRDKTRAQHGLYGTVTCVGNGRGPRNVAVLLDRRIGGIRPLTVVVARGNLRAVTEDEA